MSKDSSKPFGGVDKVGTPLVVGSEVKFVYGVQGRSEERYQRLVGKVGVVNAVEDVGYTGMLQIRVVFPNISGGMWCHFEELLVV